MGGGEQKYIQEAFDTNWIAPLGKNVDELENICAKFVGKGYGAATVSGTSAIHLALKLCGLSEGDTVICSDFTFMGSCDGVMYEKATPVFVGSEKDTLNMSPEHLDSALKAAKKKGKLPKAIIIVDLYGTAADYDKLLPVADSYGVPVIEDAAEAFGGSYKGKKLGGFGKYSILSFNGNKIITASGGGMLLTGDKADADKAKFWSTQSREKAVWYEHREVGYNYRLSNICAGIARGQMEVLEKRVAQKKAIHARYAEAFKSSALHIFMPPRGDSNYWLSVGVIDKSSKVKFTDIIDALAARNIESRPLWKPMHLQPLFAGCEYYGDGLEEDAFSRGICLPSDTKMTEEEQMRVIETVKGALGE
ncbi:MAG: aminotransferase class I/II-fold pyridoxal phosphate-dependent enzyme [Clostridiales bacterium]|nr:aminotransferase class I/II-fold pyridoxal phosphate-dependent enzyme [Clostridiales bacterium]